MKELGKRLKFQRLSQGLTLAEISQRSRIGIGTLQELEAGNFDRVGSEFIVYSYLRAYGEALNEHPPRWKENAPPAAKDSRPDVFSLDLQRTRSQLVRWRAFAITLSVAMVILILSEVLWILNRHPLNTTRQIPPNRWKTSQTDLKPPKAEESASHSEKTSDLGKFQAEKEQPGRVPPQMRPIPTEQSRIDPDGERADEEQKQKVSAVETAEDSSPETEIDFSGTKKTTESSARNTQQSLETPLTEGSRPVETRMNGQGAQTKTPPFSVGLLNQPESGNPAGRMAANRSIGDHASPDEVTTGDSSHENPVLSREPDRYIPGNSIAEQQATSTEEFTDEKHVLEIQAIAECWIELKTDSKTLDRELLRAGERRTWEVDGEVELVVGNAGGVNLKWDGHALGSLGKSDRVARLRLPDPTLVEKD